MELLYRTDWRHVSKFNIICIKSAETFVVVVCLVFGVFFVNPNLSFERESRLCKHIYLKLFVKMLKTKI